MDTLRELDAMTARLRLKHHEWFPDDMPDSRDRDAFEGWLGEREEQRRREFRGRLVSQPLKPVAGRSKKKDAE